MESPKLINSFFYTFIYSFIHCESGVCPQLRVGSILPVEFHIRSNWLVGQPEEVKMPTGNDLCQWQ